MSRMRGRPVRPIPFEHANQFVQERRAGDKIQDTQRFTIEWSRGQTSDSAHPSQR